ncbi:MAG: hypothetical protein V1922_05810 [bacterium]
MIKQFEPVRIALQNERVVSFVQKQYLSSYQRYFSGHEDEVETMIKSAFSLLIESHRNYSKIHIPSLEKATKDISRNLFHIHDDTHWFNKMHYAYKLFVRPKQDYAFIHQYLLNGNVHDFGCDGGYFSFELLKNNHNIFLSDIVDHRIKEINHVPFYLMKTPIDVQKMDTQFDNGIVKTVLHHINGKYLKTVLRKLRSMHKRIIIEEDIFGIPTLLQYCSKNIIRQEAMQQYASLDLNEQYQYNILTDFFSNAVIYNRLDINFPFQFHTVEEWISILHEVGFTNVICKVTGFNEWKLTQNCQAWFICD